MTESGKNVLVTADKVSFGFEVVGILKEQNTGMENSSSSTYIPRGFYAKKITPNPEASTIMVQATSNEFFHAACFRHHGILPGTDGHGRKRLGELDADDD